MSEENNEELLHFLEFLALSKEERITLMRENRPRLREVNNYMRKLEYTPFNKKKALKKLKSLDLPEVVKTKLEQILSYKRLKFKGTFGEYIDKKHSKYPSHPGSLELKPSKTIVSKKEWKKEEKIKKNI